MRHTCTCSNARPSPLDACVVANEGIARVACGQAHLVAGCIDTVRHVTVGEGRGSAQTARCIL